jgi:hypothetical protein
MSDSYNGPERREDYATRTRITDIRLWLVKQQRRVVILFAIQVLILMAQAVVFTVQLREVQNDAAKAREAASLGQCRRVNNLRHQTNVTEAAVYLTLNQAAMSARLQRTAQGQHIASQYRTFARVVAFTADTNCQKALHDPLGYKPPTPVPYHKLPKGFAEHVIRDPGHSPQLPPHHR